MAVLMDLIVAILRALVPALIQELRPTAVDGDPDATVRKKLAEQVRSHGLILLTVPALLLLTGCGVRTIYVPHGTPVRLRETIPDAKVWVKDADGKPVAGQMDLPEGWYSLPVDDQE